ncbi:MAG: thermostable hemolysin [Limibacillus sp.]|jgi:hypothetical protein
MSGIPSTAPAAVSSKLLRVEQVGPDHPLRQEVEAMVRSVYAASYAANVSSFPHRMLAVLSPCGQPLCAAGIRDCQSGFFSECYLSDSVETEISRRLCRPVAREQVMEVTTLAAWRPGFAFGLIDCAIQLGRSEGILWGLCTATAPLRRSMARIGAPLLELADAQPEKVSEPWLWGSYYDLNPRVCLLQDPQLRPPFRPTLPALVAGNDELRGQEDA